MNKLPEDEERRRLDMWESGMTDAQIAEECCVCRETIYQWRRSRKLCNNSEGGRPASIDRQEAIAMIRAGYSNSIIAMKMDCDPKSIGYIRRRYT